MNRLYRSRTDAMIAGVCGGLGRYLGVDSTLVRLFFVLLTIANGIGLLIYLVMAIVVPRAPEGEEITQPPTSLRENPNAGLIIGGGLIVIGLVAFLDNLNVPWLRWFELETLWPLLLILGGLALLLRVYRGEA